MRESQLSRPALSDPPRILQVRPATSRAPQRPEPGAPLTLKSFHYGRLDDPWYLAHRDDPGGAVPPRIGPEFPTEAWPTLHELLAQVRREPPSGMIETDAGIVIPMHESDIWELGQRAVPERESRWETEELLAFWAFPNTPEADVGQWCLVWRRM